MGERLSNLRMNNGISRSTLRLIGVCLLILGMLSRGILQYRVLGIGTGANVMEVLEMTGGMSAAATALALQAMESCAVPVFAMLLTEGFAMTGSFRKYILRVAAVALVSEIPYDFVLCGRFFDLSSQNPAFGSVICLAVMYLCRNYPGWNIKNVFIRTVVLLAALLWCLMLHVQYGVLLLVAVTMLWSLRDRPALKNFLAAAAVLCCCVADPLTMFAPLGFLLAHFYNGEEGQKNRLMQYALYPVSLVLIGMAGVLLFGNA